MFSSSAFSSSNTHGSSFTCHQISDETGAFGFISVAQRHGAYQQEYCDTETGRYFYLYEQEEFCKLLRRNGFIIEQTGIHSHTTHRTWLTSWLIFLCVSKTYTGL